MDDKKPNTHKHHDRQAVRPWVCVTRDYDDNDLFARQPATEREAFQWMFRRWARAFNDDESGLKRGQFRCSYAELARRLNQGAKEQPWTKGGVESFVKRCVARGMLSVSSDKSGTVFTVENYEKYQPERLETPDGSQTATRRQRDGNETQNSRDNNNFQNTPDGSQTATRRQRDGNETHRDTTYSDTRFERQEDPPAAEPNTDPAGGDPASAGSSSSDQSRPKTTFVDERGHDWPHADKVGREYPAPFEAIWSLWLDLRKQRGGDTVKPGAKAAAYRALRSQLVQRRVTATEAYRAARAYTAAFTVADQRRWPSPTTQHVATFYGTKRTWEDWIAGEGDADGAVDYEPTTYEELASLEIACRHGGGPVFSGIDGWRSLTAEERGKALAAARSAGFYG